MISQQELRTLAQARLEDAEILAAAGRPHGAAYVCGYAVELSLKARICQTLGWPGFPATAKEFENYRSFKTHHLEVLLHLSGIESQIVKSHLLEWSVVSTWTPELRYTSVAATTQNDADQMIQYTKTLLPNL